MQKARAKEDAAKAAKAVKKLPSKANSKKVCTSCKAVSRPGHKMHDFCILTPTFNRADQLAKVIDALQQGAAKRGFSVLHCLVDDGSKGKQGQYRRMMGARTNDSYRFVLEENFKNFGRTGFWKTWNKLMAMAKAHDWENAIAMPDDHMPCEDFLFRVRSHMDALRRTKDGRAVAMNILVKSRRNWQRNRFVDGAFICKRVFFECLNWKMQQVGATWFDTTDVRNRLRKKANPPSSGVGKQMTDRMALHQKWRIARVRDVSFLLQMDTQSVMFPPKAFPERPLLWGIGRANFIDNPNRRSGF